MSGDSTAETQQLPPNVRAIVADEVKRAIDPLISHFEEIKTTVHETRTEVKAVKSCLETDVSGTPGILERQRITDARVDSLETADKIRNRTVWGAVAAVGSAILHTIWKAVTGGGAAN